MGCDIHLYVEKKNTEGKWEQFEVPDCLLPDERDCRVFGFLAGVRDRDYEPQFESRHIPNDTSLCADQYLGDHSRTYATLEELLDAPWEDAGLEDTYFCVFCFYVLPRLCCTFGTCDKEEQRNIRILMGFDS